MNTQEFLLWEMRSRDTIDVKRCYVDIAGDLVSGVLLSQIIYWHLPDEHGKSKLRVHHDGHDWLAKKREDWWDECRVSPKQFDRAADILEKRGLVVTHLYRFAGSPTKHIRMNWDGFFESLKSLQDTVFPQRSKSNSSPSDSIFPKGQNPNPPNGKMEIDEEGKIYTESTAENPTENTYPPTPQGEMSECEEKSASLEESGIPTNTPLTEQPCQPSNSINDKPDPGDKDSALPPRDNNGRYIRNQAQYPKDMNGIDILPWETQARGVFDEGFENHMTHSLKNYPSYQGLLDGELKTKVRKHISGGKHDMKRRDELVIEWEAYRSSLIATPKPSFTPQVSYEPLPEKKCWLPPVEEREAFKQQLLARRAGLK